MKVTLNFSAVRSHRINLLLPGGYFSLGFHNFRSAKTRIMMGDTNGDVGTSALTNGHV